MSSYHSTKLVSRFYRQSWFDSKQFLNDSVIRSSRAGNFKKIEVCSTQTGRTASAKFQVNKIIATICMLEYYSRMVGNDERFQS
eukprot:g3948.t1